MFVLSVKLLCYSTDFVYSMVNSIFSLLVHTVGIAVDGDPQSNGLKLTVLVKRSGKVVELEKDISGMYKLIV